MKLLHPVICTVALGAFALIYPLAAQSPQGPQGQNDRGRQQARPANGGNGGANLSRPGNGQSQRPNPGGSSGAKPRPPQRPNPGPRPTPSRPPHARPPQWGHRPPQRPSYSFRPNDRSYLRRYYLSRLARVNRSYRVHLVIGGFFPYADISYISPLPPNIYGYLPPPPPGYTMGYYEGYVIIYDPVTFYIANVIDLLQ